MSPIHQVRRVGAAVSAPPIGSQDYLAEVDVEFARWAELTALVQMLTPDERLAPGYFRDPDWSVKDLMAHLAAWLTEAARQLTDIAARAYVPHDVDIDARNQATLAATKNESWDAIWARASWARAEMLEHWFALRAPSEDANQWVRKAGAEHYGEHLERLRAWVGELIEARTRPPSKEWDS